jgi:tetratricopeptide (TPR) repeat protein
LERTLREIERSNMDLEFGAESLAYLFDVADTEPVLRAAFRAELDDAMLRFRRWNCADYLERRDDEWIAQGKSGRAEASYRMSLLPNPEQPWANSQLGLLLAGRGNLEEAETHLRRALESDPGLSAAREEFPRISARQPTRPGDEAVPEASSGRP